MLIVEGSDVAGEQGLAWALVMNGLLLDEGRVTVEVIEMELWVAALVLRRHQTAGLLPAAPVVAVAVVSSSSCVLD